MCFCLFIAYVIGPFSHDTSSYANMHILVLGPFSYVKSFYACPCITSENMAFVLLCRSSLLSASSYAMRFSLTE